MNRKNLPPETVPQTLPTPLRPGLRIPSTFRALRHRNFRLYWTGQLISLIGTFMQSVGQGWLVYQLSGSALMLGVVGFAQFSPVLVLSPLGGILADRFPKRDLLLLTQSAMLVLALGLGALTWLGVVQVWHVVVLALLLGVCNALDAPTRQSFVVEMVGKADLMNAIALNSSVFNGARLIGPTLAALLIGPLGIASLFFLNALAFLAIIVNLLRMKLAPFEKPKKTSPWDSLKEGFSYLRSNREIRALLSLVGISSLCGAPYVTLLPAYAAQVLGSDASGYGFLMAGVATGGLIAALTLASGRAERRKGRTLLAGSFTFALLLIAFSLSGWYWLSWISLIGVGWGFLTQNASTNTLVQTLAPDALRGRVMSAYAWVLMGLFPVGSLLAGALASWWGPDRAILIGAVLLLAYTGWMYVNRPQIRSL